MSPSNYHTHTTFCDGENTPEEMVQKAVALGCPEIGFSGHSYAPYDTANCMSQAGTEEYRQCVLALREKYRGKIVIRLGVEQDYYAPAPKQRYDYVIGAVHYLQPLENVFFPVDQSEETLCRGVMAYYGGDFYAMAEDYYDKVARLYQKTGCQVVAHFDLITKFNEQNRWFDTSHPRYRNAAMRALHALAASPVVFEINTGAISRGYRSEPYPEPFLLDAIRKANRAVMFSSDSHRADTLLFGYEKYLELTAGWEAEQKR